MAALPPATLEGWYMLHQIFRFRGAVPAHANATAVAAHQLFDDLNSTATAGWSAPFQIVAGGADLLVIHARPTLDEAAAAELRLRTSPLAVALDLVYDYLSVTEAGLYHATAEAARAQEPGSPEFATMLRDAKEREAASAHIQTRLYPTPPADMAYVSFYPMSKRRAVGQNWYALSIEERNRLMRDHGLTGRRFAGRVFQIISGSIGLDDWEWGVTLFARDPMEFKRIVTEMRYDEASAVYGEFGRFFTGIRLAPERWDDLLAGPTATIGLPK